MLRIVVVKDKQQVADQSPTWLDVFDSHEVQTHRNYLAKGRFTILSDRTITLPQNGDSAKAGTLYKATKHVVRYNGATGSDIQKGGIYVLAISNESTNTPYLRWQANCQYYDN